MTTHTIRFQRTLTYQPDDPNDPPLDRDALMEIARGSWHDGAPWIVELEGHAYLFDPPAPEVLDRDVLTALNALADRYPAMNPVMARDYALTVLHAVSGRCSDCGQVLAEHEGPTCARDRATAGLM